ncbi:hypothetical protein ACFXKI_46970 [Streptomyces mirabilis]
MLQVKEFDGRGLVFGSARGSRKGRNWRLALGRH